MGKKKESNVTVTVYGIAYPEFAKLKWQQFLRGFSLAVALLVLIVLALALGGKLPREMPLTVILVLVLAVLVLLAGVVLCRTYWVGQQTAYAASAGGQSVQTLTLPRARGDFYGPHGPQA